jgi:hypothetical protein
MHELAILVMRFVTTGRWTPAHHATDGSHTKKIMSAGREDVPQRRLPQSGLDTHRLMSGSKVKHGYVCKSLKGRKENCWSASGDDFATFVSNGD